MVEDSAFICGKLVCVWRSTAWILVNAAQLLNSGQSLEEMIA